MVSEGKDQALPGHPTRRRHHSLFVSDSTLRLVSAGKPANPENR